MILGPLEGDCTRLRNALDELVAGKDVRVSDSRPFGCSIKWFSVKSRVSPPALVVGRFQVMTLLQAARAHVLAFRLSPRNHGSQQGYLHCGGEEGFQGRHRGQGNR